MGYFQRPRRRVPLWGGEPRAALAMSVTLSPMLGDFTGLSGQFDDK
jgi:hypothetical protein